MADSDSLDPTTLDAYLAGTLTGAERERVERLLSAQPALRALVASLPAATEPAQAASPSAAAWRNVSARIAAAGSPVETDDLARRRARTAAPTGAQAARTAGWARRATRIAAALVVVVGGAAVWRATSGGGVLEAPRGREVAATLPDGSRIRLAPGSRITWTRTFGRSARDLQLDGEAWFDVVHDASRPFRVHSRYAVAEDIGTRFVVRAWPELGTVDVAVEEGRVALADSSMTTRAQATVLSAGQRGVLAESGVVRVDSATTATLAWTRGALQFDQTPLPLVVAELSRRFAVTISADSALATRTLSARFTTEPVADVVNAIALSLGVTVERRDRGLRLTLPTRE